MHTHQNTPDVSLKDSDSARKGVVDVNEGEVTSYVEDVRELSDLDEAFQDALGTKGIEIDPEKERALVRKIDWYIIPIMVALNSCQLMDKSSNSYASIMGLLPDLNMTSYEYSWVGSAFYLGYLFFEYPANLIIQRFPMAKVLSSAVILWGIVVAVHGACHTPATFLLCRTILGCLESFLAPCFMIMTSQWYRKEEQYIRSACWLGLQGFGTMLGSGIAYAFYNNQDAYTMAPWRLLYFALGSITIFFGIITAVHVPDLPTKAWFLNEEERSYCVERIRANRTGFGNPHFKWSQLKEAMLDPCIYLFFFYMFGYGITNGAMGNFGSILLKNRFGFSTGPALLMNMVGSGINIVFPIMFAYIAKYIVKSRLIVGGFINCCVLMGVCLLAFCENAHASLFGYYIIYWSTAGWACMSSVISSNVGGHTKKITFNTLFLIGFAAGNLVGPQTLLGEEAPRYPTSGKVMASTYTMPALEPIVLLFIYKKRNSTKVDNVDGDDTKLSFGDLTDIKNPVFKYIT
ncbi:CYFA0S26e01112g1_1 [Cyberlindnera fabianii]|uniref:CYFA0S26e01112g1_1 n=1 Tax=Cyberlindnera fabianii TaxID=36022 RepID=A0A061BIS3_CYBFA|nr:CYFA0S26e01112g1_1 [Cyberlindnera fabianii]